MNNEEVIMAMVEDLNADGYELRRDQDQHILFYHNRIVCKNMSETLDWLNEKTNS